MSFFTIGHSNHEIGEFIEILQSADIERVVDVRSIPRSRHNPQFNEDILPDELAEVGIAYQRIAKLGGYRGSTHKLAPGVNAFWQNASFHRYADYTATEDFWAGLEELIELGRTQRVAFMCSEVLWWRCHRRIITDYLLARGEEVTHIMGKDKFTPAAMNPGAQVQDDGTITYPATEA